MHFLFTVHLRRVYRGRRWFHCSQSDSSGGPTGLEKGISPRQSLSFFLSFFFTVARSMRSMPKMHHVEQQEQQDVSSSSYLRDNIFIGLEKSISRIERRITHPDRIDRSIFSPPPWQAGLQYRIDRYKMNLFKICSNKVQRTGHFLCMLP